MIFAEPKPWFPSAQEAAGNWREFQSFYWSGAPADADNWAIVYLHDRNAPEAIELAGNRAAHALRNVPGVSTEDHAHWLCGSLRAVAFRAVRNGRPTRAYDAVRRAAGLFAFTRCYYEAALWASVDDEGVPLDYGHTLDDLDADAIDRMAADCRRFWCQHWRTILEHPDQAGHDLWLTRNGHGAGFWDRPELWGDHADALSAAAEAMGESTLYVDGETIRLY